VISSIASSSAEVVFLHVMYQTNLVNLSTTTRIAS
jgi:hypothetical protein